nr:galactose-3-O-sulfotransferase 3-like [Penaeus vannamei]
MLVVLCVVSSMALVLQLNLANQQSFMLRNIKGFEEPRGWTPRPRPPPAARAAHLVFLKTHKCGSSTIQNILFRYAFHNNLSVALPYSGVYLDNTLEGQSLKVKDLRDSPFAPPSGRYHFLIHHTRLNVRAIQQLSFDDSVWITIVREPSAVFESMFHYYRLHKFYGATFDHLLWKLEGGFSSRFKLNNMYMGRLGRNQMTWDMGLDDQDLRQEAVLKEALKLLDHTFHLVMVSGRRLQKNSKYSYGGSLRSRLVTMRTLFLYESQFSSESLAVRVLPKDEGININFSLFQYQERIP